MNLLKVSIPHCTHYPWSRSAASLRSTEQRSQCQNLRWSRPKTLFTQTLVVEIATALLHSGTRPNLGSLRLRLNKEVSMMGRMMGRMMGWMMGWMMGRMMGRKVPLSRAFTLIPFLLSSWEAEASYFLNLSKTPKFIWKKKRRPNFYPCKRFPTTSIFLVQINVWFARYVTSLACQFTRRWWQQPSNNEHELTLVQVRKTPRASMKTICFSLMFGDVCALYRSVKCGDSLPC